MDRLHRLIELSKFSDWYKCIYPLYVSCYVKDIKKTVGERERERERELYNHASRS